MDEGQFQKEQLEMNAFAISSRLHHLMRDGHLRWFGCVEQKHFDCTGGQLLGEGGDGLMYVEGFTRTTRS